MSVYSRNQEKIVLKLSRDEVMREFFTPLEQLKRQEKEPVARWCDLSEARLIQLLTYFKPAGVNRFFNLHSIYIFMSHIYEKEDGCEIFLNDYDFETIISRLELYWDMKVVEYNEGVPDGFEAHSEFFLPDGQFSELMKEKEEENAVQTTFPTPLIGATTSVVKRRSRRGGSHDSLEPILFTC
ncbi:CT20 family protein [Dictyocaulus viviparus]|uniref:CT20 family protein n=1 Tax=Dictyocaulus viviparus TaxID=29172 RepID=A0A0D8XZB8_DICVI|nr:CT20 family protein [Dictyocaulus viviparus]